MALIEIEDNNGKLDAILKFLNIAYDYDKNPDPPISIFGDREPGERPLYDIRIGVSFDQNVSYISEVPLILKKLKRDKYITSRKVDENQSAYNMFCITFEGRIFIENGGYAQKKLNDENERSRIRRLERITFAISIAGAIFAGSILVIELFRFCFDFPFARICACVPK